MIQWRFLRRYRIAHALPGQQPEMLERISETAQLRNRLFICGDYRENATINGAMVSEERRKPSCEQRVQSKLMLKAISD
ncbi:MAG: hypothetical protein LV473_03655 [Nitrospira sp.]|nr:hypothetical protein [Nitrospira sp.]